MMNFGLACVCPVCGNECEDGEYIDVGPGSQQCGPGHCLMCGWIESSCFQDNSGGLTVDQARHLWQLQIEPGPGPQ